MKKINLDPFFVVLIVIILFFVLTFFLKYINSVKSRISELEDQLRNDFQHLELSRKRQEELTNKAVKAYRLVVTAIFGLLFSLISLTVISGASYVDALEIHIGTSGIVLTMTTVIFYKTWNPDVLLKFLMEKIKTWIYKMNGFDPNTLEFLERKISIEQIELSKLRTQNLEVYTEERSFTDKFN